MSSPYQETYGSLLDAFSPRAHDFSQACRDPAGAQQERLRRLSVELGLGRLDRLEQLADAAPISTYADLSEDITAVARGESTGLRGQRARWLEQTGGSTGERRLLPITDAYLEELHAGLAPWLHGLFTTFPAARRGPAYWSISPIGRGPRSTPGGVPLGALDDAVYFPSPFDRLLQSVLAVPGAVALLEGMGDCRYVTALHLLARRDLAFISVWSPTFLSLLLQTIDEHGPALLDDLRRGRCRPPSGPLPPSLVDELTLPPLPDIADALADCRHQAGFAFERVWPSLGAVSLWADAESARFVPAVERALPGVALQPKGLLATEGIVSLPVPGAPAPVVAVQSHVYELLPEGDPDARPCFLHEAEQGRTYEVVLTTGAGLLRYRLGDRVEVVGFHHATPCLRFLGRAGAVCDLVGEKLSAAQVEDALARAVDDPRDFAFALVAPVIDRGPPRYRLYVEAAASDDALAALACELERALTRWHPYRHARRLGQLDPVDVVRVRGGAASFERRGVDRGQRAGDIKPALLRPETDWDQTLEVVGGPNYAPGLAGSRPTHGPRRALPPTPSEVTS